MKLVLCTLFWLAGWSAFGEPQVDGVVTEGEYAHRLDLLDGELVVFYQKDASGGLAIAVRAPTTGWVGVGLGSPVMAGARIFMGYVKEGRPVFSEQLGKGHSHSPTMGVADASAVSQKNGMTTVEFHLPAAQVPPGAEIPVIAASSSSADLTSFHEDNHDSGTLVP